MAKVTEKDVGRTVEVNGSQCGVEFKKVRGVIKEVGGGYPQIAVDFFESSERYHDCCGLCRENHGYYIDHSRITFVDEEFKPEYFSALNAQDAKHLVGKEVEFSDDPADGWEPGVLLEIDKDAPHFETEEDYFEYIRTVPEKPKENELLPFLEKAFVQWTIMALLGKSKEEAYFMVDPTSDNRQPFDCFLCDAVFEPRCPKCLIWTDRKATGIQNPCMLSGSVYRRWSEIKSPENAQKVADYLKSELDKMKGGKK